MDGFNDEQKAEISRWVRVYGPTTVRTAATVVSAALLRRGDEMGDDVRAQVRDALSDVLRSEPGETAKLVMCLASMVESSLQATASVMVLAAGAFTGDDAGQVLKVWGLESLTDVALVKLWQPWVGVMLAEAAVADGQG